MSAISTTLIKEHHHVVRERVFAPHEFERLMLLLHEERATGQLIMDLNQGGVGSIRFREEQKVNFPQENT